MQSRLCIIDNACSNSRAKRGVRIASIVYKQTKQCLQQWSRKVQAKQQFALWRVGAIFNRPNQCKKNNTRLS